MAKTSSLLLTTLGATLLIMACASLVEGIVTSDLLAMPASLPRLGFILVLSIVGVRCLVGARHQEFAVGGPRWAVVLLSGVVLLIATLVVLWLVVAA